MWEKIKKTGKTPGQERVMGFEPTISCLGSKRSTTELHPRVRYYTATFLLAKSFATEIAEKKKNLWVSVAKAFKRFSSVLPKDLPIKRSTR